MREFLRKDRCALLNGAPRDSRSETATAPGWVADPEIASFPVSSLELRRAAEPHQVSGVLIQSDTPTTPTLAVGFVGVRAYVRANHGQAGRTDRKGLCRVDISKRARRGAAERRRAAKDRFINRCVLRRLFSRPHLRVPGDRRWPVECP